MEPSASMDGGQQAMPRAISLRNLFYVVGLLAAFCGGWVASDVDRYRRDVELSEAVKKHLVPMMNDLRIASDKIARDHAINASGGRGVE